MLYFVPGPLFIHGASHLGWITLSFHSVLYVVRMRVDRESRTGVCLSSVPHVYFFPHSEL